MGLVSISDAVTVVFIMTLANMALTLIFWRFISQEIEGLHSRLDKALLARGRMKAAAPSRRPTGADLDTAAGNGTSARRARWRG